MSTRTGGLRGIIASLGRTQDDRHYLIRSDHAVPDSDVERNAHLIAAAPAMLFELRSLRSVIASVSGLEDQLPAIDAVLAKAEGVR